MNMRHKVSRGAEPKTFIGRVESVDRHSEGKASRFSFVIDAVDEGYDPDGHTRPVLEWDHEKFALIRVMTTFNKFAAMAGISEIEPENLVGQWIALSLFPYGSVSGPLAQVCTLGEVGYDSVTKYVVGDISNFGEDPDFPRTLSAAGDPLKKIASRLAKEGRISPPTISRHQCMELWRQLWIGKAQLKEIRVSDVGHANFTTIFDTNHEPVLHFDVGWPVGFNKRTLSGTPPAIVAAPFVILSHWDWDHLHGYHVWKQLQDKIWVAPIQDMGPGASKVAHELQKKGKLVSLPSSKKLAKCKSIFLGHCNPSHAKTKAKRRNNSGLFLGLRLASGRVALLPGDADYRGISWPCTTAPDLLVVSHHGAAVSGGVQKPQNPNSTAVISMGNGNVYRHPCLKTLKDHQRLGWKLVFTSKWKGVPRGDRVLS
ncbi:hypothetical protein KUW17_18830 [Leisingera aquaemixtae]|uniref:hypothetical protein n=1 Tax=Leisingera aquaemixtae TaxID=1396826 RepID=UPI001C967194|nr:hypothetical protein [Leisingera aquaemixtae]MBY6068805.1 hypothetical protein [Leisingera aquaemixtae]